VDVDRVVKELGSSYPSERIFGQACDVTDFEQVQALWDASKVHFGTIEIWINNAGQAHTLHDFWDLPVELMDQLVRVNVIGQMYGAKVAVNGMLEQGGGAFFIMEGQGAGGRVVKGLTLYGATKRAGNFLFNALSVELKDTPVMVGSIQPGMVLTDLLLAQRKDDPESWEQTKKIFNILADKVETVVPKIVDQVLSAKKNGTRINLLGGGKVFWRFLTAGFSKRDLFADEDQG
jgi:NADP-dependent 3-hydroxy acid dehydrogenase YdfG